MVLRRIGGIKKVSFQVISTSYIKPPYIIGSEFHKVGSPRRYVEAPPIQYGYNDRGTLRSVIPAHTLVPYNWVMCMHDSHSVINNLVI